MREPEEIQTQPEPEYIARAGDLIEAVLAGEIDIQARLALGAALAILCDVHPPYPPRPEPATTLDLPTGIRLALQTLNAAKYSAPTVADAIRAGLAARELQQLRDRR